MPAREPAGRRRSPHIELKTQLDTLRALDSDPDAQRELAETYVRGSKNMELLRPALTVLKEHADASLRPLLHEKYAWCEGAPERNDSGGFVRAAIIQALQPIIGYDDLPILQRALVSYQMVGMYETAAGLRVAALQALYDLEPDLAALWAARFLLDPRNSNSGEPAVGAIRLLAAQQHLAPVFAIASWPIANSEITAEALRNLVDLPTSLVPLLIATWSESEDEQVLLGLYDLLLAHPSRSEWRDVIERFLRRTRMLDLYALVVTQIVATRDQELIALLRELADEENDRIRYELLRSALEHA